jgi:hypothetical protein
LSNRESQRQRRLLLGLFSVPLLSLRLIHLPTRQAKCSETVFPFACQRHNLSTLCMSITYTPNCGLFITIFVQERERGRFNRARNGASGEPRQSRGGVTLLIPNIVPHPFYRNRASAVAGTVAHTWRAPNVKPSRAAPTSGTGLVIPDRRLRSPNSAESFTKGFKITNWVLR